MAAAGLPIRWLSAADMAACVELAADRGWPPERNKLRLLFAVGEVYGIDDSGRGPGRDGGADQVRSAARGGRHDGGVLAIRSPGTGPAADELPARAGRPGRGVS